MEFLNEVSQRIKFFRKEKGLTQETLAQNADIDISFLGKIERGVNNNISLETLNKIIEALDVEYAEFFAFSDSKKKIDSHLSLQQSEALFLIFNKTMSAKNRDELIQLLQQIVEMGAK